MRKKFKPFDREVIVKELQTIEGEHLRKLYLAMTTYANRTSGSYSPALVKDYGGGIEMIRHENNEYQGRVLFTEHENQYTILAAYKKESQEVPSNVLKRARKRM